MSTPRKIKLHVTGMHCKSCEVLTESELQEHPKVRSVSASLTERTVEITGEFDDSTPEQIAEEMSARLTKHGYSLTTKPPVAPVAKWKEFGLAAPLAFALITLFVVLQKVGIVNVVDTSQVSYGTAFVVGIIASLSTCMAVVGGLLLSMSATFAREGDKVRPQLLFHTGRLVSFFLLGGVIGGIGSAFQLGATGTFVLGLLVALVMLILGLNLLDVFQFTKRLQPAMPKFLSGQAKRFSTLQHTLTPALVGIATFFLPCGFTQSMQIYTLTTGGFWSGALTMFSFALGTLPVLALVSFSSLGIRDTAKSGVFFKTAGLVVIAFALFNLLNSLVAFGLLPPLFSF